MKTRMNRFLLITAGASLAFATSAHAATIALNNASLEAPSYYNANAQYPGWVGINNWEVNFTGWSMSGNRGASPVAYDGSQGLWTVAGYGWNGVSQNSTYTVGAAGITLTAAVYGKSASTAWFNLQLLLDGSQMSFAQPYFASATDWTQITTSYVTTVADIGKIVGISFGMESTNNYAYMDSASLSVIPEPGAALLGGLGMLALLRRRR